MREQVLLPEGLHSVEYFAGHLSNQLEKILLAHPPTNPVRNVQIVRQGNDAVQLLGFPRCGPLLVGVSKLRSPLWLGPGVKLENMAGWKEWQKNGYPAFRTGLRAGVRLGEAGQGNRGE